MEDLILEESSNTPFFYLKKDGEFRFGGASMPEDAASFFFKIMDWVSDYYRNPNSETNIFVNFSYLNSSSSSMIFKLFDAFQRLQETGKTEIKCTWYYEEEDEHMKEYIETIQEYVTNVPFNVVSVADVDSI